METEEKQRVDTPRRQLRKRLAFHWVVILLGTVIIYLIGAVFRIWSWPGLLLSFLITLISYAFYMRMMPRRLTKINYDGLKYLKTGEYQRALEIFKQFYDMYDQNPDLEKQHARLLLDNGVYFRPREVALSNQAAAYVQLGNRLEAIRCYEECLTLNPQNGMALLSLNLAAAVSGGEMRPPPPQVSPLVCIKWVGGSKSRLQGYASILLIFMAFPCCLIPLFSSLLQQSSGEGSTTVLALALILAGLFSIMMISQLTRSISRLTLRDYYRGSKLYQRHQYREGIQAFQKQVDLFEKRPWLNNRRRLFKRAKHVSYLEWTLIWLAYGYTQLGEGEQLLPIYQQVLEINPNNESAQTNIKFINLFRDQEV